MGYDRAHLMGVQAHSTDQAGGAGTIEAYHPTCPAGKLLPNQNDLISKSRLSHSSLVVARLSQVVAL
jgi:hypothetical protein